MSDYLLDSSFLIDYFNEVADGIIGPARSFRARLRVRARLFASIVSLSEMLEGASDPLSVERELQRLVSLLGLHRPHARRAGLIQRRARMAGTKMGENDAWIAATAALARLTLVGNDDRAFTGRAGVTYVNYRG